MRLFQSLSFRLALTYVGLFCVSVAALLGMYYWLNIQQPLDVVKQRVDLEMREMSQIYIVEGRDALVAALDARASKHEADEPFHAFIDADGRVITANLPSWPKSVTPGWLEIEADIYHNGDETDHNAMTRDRKFQDGRRLLIGRDTEDIADLQESLGETAAWILSGTVVLGIVGGLLMSLAIRRRIEAVNRAALTVIRGDLSGRVPVRGTGDDFDRLGETLNLMLARIEELFESVRRVSDSVAHELRTPLTRLLSRLERLETIDDASERQAMAEGAIAEARRLDAIFDALLRIARIETGRHQSAMQPVDISKLVAAVAEFHEPDAENRSIGFETEIASGLQATADPDLLFQALSNLLDNAFKYTPAGGRVKISADTYGGLLTLTVSDNGRGIDPAETSRLTERFYRGAGAADLPGEGLGLSLVAAVVHQHHGALAFTDNHPGLRVDFSLPLVDRSSDQQSLS